MKPLMLAQESIWSVNEGIDHALPWIAALPPSVAHVLFGVLGGIVYMGRMRMKGYAYQKGEVWMRPLVGGLAAFVITGAFGLPNHTTSLFVGYFGIDLWDGAASIMARKFGEKLPGGFLHMTRDELDTAIQTKVAEQEEARKP